MTPEKSDQSPIDPAELEMHARVEIGLIDPFPGYDYHAGKDRRIRPKPHR